MRRSVQILILLVGAVVAMPSTTFGKTLLDVSMGWDGSVRVGRWTPVFVTVSDDKSRPVAIELDVPQGGPYVMRLRQFVTIGPQPTTLTLYAPAQEMYGDPPVVVIRDADSAKTLAKWPAEMDIGSRGYEQIVQGSEKFIGVTGPNRRLDALVSASGVQMRVAGMKPDLLPDQPVGYDALDLLVLHRADLNTIERARQQAIADWVRAGGCLLLWPSPEPIPADGPIGQILPAKVGGPKNYEISAAQRKASGFQARFKGIVGHELTPVADAEAIPLLPPDAEGSAMTAYARDHGFGRVIIAPVNLNELSFSDSSNGAAFYKKVLAGTGVEADSGRSNRSYYGLDAASQLQQHATSSLQDHLANVPGAGRFGFSYVVWVVLGMMAVVGPLDWFVLKRLGRQPWTWVTTIGWIAAITIGALFIGRVFKSGDLHYRTVTLVDQADGQTVARSTLAGIYSPQTAEYHFDAAPTQTDANGKPVPTLQPPSGWWEPASATQFGGGGGMKVDVPFRQTTEGNLPQPMTINVWNMRALRGENLITDEPMIRADLKIVTVGKEEWLEGTITNLSPHPLKDVRVQVGKGFASVINSVKPSKQSAPMDNRGNQDNRLLEMVRATPLLSRIEPGQTAAVKGLIAASTESPDKENQQPYYNYYDREPPPQNSIWAFAAGIAGRRALRVEQALEHGDRAAVYALVDQATPNVVLREDTGAHQRHDIVLRALVKVQGQERKQP